MNRRHASSLPWLATLLLSFSMAGCSYLGDRALDILDPYRISVGAGSTLGVRAAALGVVDSGLMIGVKPNMAALGWRYGKPLFFNQGDITFDADQAQIIQVSSIRSFDYGDGAYRSATSSFALLPALFSWTDATPTDYEWTVPEDEDVFDDMNYLWSGETFRHNRFAQIHAFDVEADIGLVVYLESGFSIGEVVDFFLGIATIDIAEDDDRL